MRVIYKAPGEAPRTMVVPNDLHTLQNLVGGYIETVTLAEDVVIICDEEGRLKDYPDNCEIGGIMFVGTILIVGADGDEFVSCPDDVIEEFAGTDEYCYEI